MERAALLLGGPGHGQVWAVPPGHNRLQVAELELARVDELEPGATIVPRGVPYEVRPFALVIFASGRPPRTAYRFLWHYGLQGDDDAPAEAHAAAILLCAGLTRWPWLDRPPPSWAGVPITVSVAEAASVDGIPLW